MRSSQYSVVLQVRIVDKSKAGDLHTSYPALCSMGKMLGFWELPSRNSLQEPALGPHSSGRADWY